MNVLDSPRTRLCSALAIVILGAGTAICIAQGMKEFSNRREGTSVHLNALNDFTLIAIHKSFHAFPRNASLNVRFFLPALPAGDKKIYVEAQELQDSFHYLMQSSGSFAWKKDDWNIFRPWPTSDVIDPLGIQPDNLGVLASYQIGNQERVYLPADVYSDPEQPSRHGYTFHIITGQDLQSVDLSLADSAGKRVNATLPELKCNKTLNPNCRLYSAGSTMAFDVDMSGLRQGEYHLQLTGHIPRTSAVTSLVIALYHHP